MLEMKNITKIYNPGTVQETCLFRDFSLKSSWTGRTSPA